MEHGTGRRPRGTRLGLAIGVALAAWGLAEAGSALAVPGIPGVEWDAEIAANARSQLRDGRQIFRFDTFGDEAFWGGDLGLHLAIAGEDNGGVGPGVSPNTALGVGLKVDVDALPRSVIGALRRGELDLDDPAVTLDLLQLDAVVGVTGFFDPHGRIESIGIQCALCHSDVDDSFASGIGRRLDGWANRDLDVGAVINLAPDLSAFADVLMVDEATVRAVLLSWGPGKFDAELILDGKAFQPDGDSAATLIPPAFGMAGVNLHTWTGFGSVPYWNAFVATLEMHGQGTFFDERLNDPVQFPVAVANGFYDVRSDPDLVTPKLPALHFYQLAIPSPEPPRGSFNPRLASRGKALFEGRARCAECHVPPLYTEPGHNLRDPAEICTDSFQADRSPARGYRTSPLGGLWSHQQGGFYHDGRFADLRAVVEHYDGCFGLGLGPEDKTALVQFLLSL